MSACIVLLSHSENIPLLVCPLGLQLMGGGVVCPSPPWYHGRGNTALHGDRSHPDGPDAFCLDDGGLTDRWRPQKGAARLKGVGVPLA